MSQTLDAVSERTFEPGKLPLAERTLVAQWIAARQGLPGAYADTFAGFPGERKDGIVVFTGERITSALVERVHAAAARGARDSLEALSQAVPVPIASIALRVCPPLPPTIEQRIADHRAQTVADTVMYRQALATAAKARGWSVAWYDRELVFLEAAAVLAALRDRKAAAREKKAARARARKAKQANKAKALARK